MKGTCKDCKYWDKENQNEGSAKCTSPRSTAKDTETFSLYSCNSFERK